MRKLVLRIFNIALCVMSAFVIVMLFTQPVVDFNIGYKVSADQIVEVFEKNIPEDKRSGINIQSIVGTEDLEVGMSLKIETKTMTSLKDKSDDEKIALLKTEVFTPAVKSVVENERVKTIIENLAKEIAKKAAKMALKSAFENYMVKDEDKGNSDFLENAGIDDSFYDSHVDALYDSITKKDADLDSVTDAICDCITDAMNLLGAQEGSEYDAYSSDAAEIKADIDEKKTEIKQELENTLKEYNLVDEDGNITSVDDAMALILQKMMDEANGSSSGGEEKPSLHAPRYADPSEEDVEKEKKSLTDTVCDAAWKMIDEKVFEGDTKTTICNVLGYIGQYGSIVLYVFMGMWALLFVFALLHIFLPKKPYIYTGFFFWFFFVLIGIFQIALGGIPLISSNAMEIATKFGATLPDSMSKLTFSLKSCFSYSFVVSVILFIFAIVYACFARKVKKERKAERRARRHAARAAQ